MPRMSTQIMSADWKDYHTVWTVLFFGWVVSYIDRTLTGPVITWMIEHKVSFMQGIHNPHAFGGLIGSLFFAGYMLTQFPGGYFGDKFGHRVVVLTSIFWAATTTLFTGLVGGLLAFVALRVLTGLGEGAFYSNDRTIIARVTPPEKMGLGMGVVISGLTLGLTIAILATPPVIKWAQPFMDDDAWRMPFLLMSLPTFIVGFVMARCLRSAERPAERFGTALRGLLGYSTIFFVAIMAIYLLAQRLAISPGYTGLILAGLALVLLAFIYRIKKSSLSPVLHNRNLVLIYLSAIPVLWHLWLYSYWAVDIIKDTGSTFMAAALTASFNAIAGLIGFPLGGWLSDHAVRSDRSRKHVLVVLTGVEALTIVGFGIYVMTGHKDPIVMAAILFVSGLFFFALQSVSHAFTAELAPAEHRGAAFGLWNLIAEIGALLSPVFSGLCRDTFGSWGPAIMLDGTLMAGSALLIVAVRTVAPHGSARNRVLHPPK